MSTSLLLGKVFFPNVSFITQMVNQIYDSDINYNVIQYQVGSYFIDKTQILDSISVQTEVVFDLYDSDINYNVIQYQVGSYLIPTIGSQSTELIPEVINQIWY